MMILDTSGKASNMFSKKDKIYYITNARMPTEKAHGYQIAKMCEQFAALGHQVVLAVPRRFNTLKDSIYTYYDIEENFCVEQLMS